MINAKVFVIKSEGRSLDRGLQRFVIENSLPLELSPAVFLDSQQSTDSLAFEVDCFLRLGRGITRSEIGIALAHREIYNRIIKEDLQWAIVFEDDAIVENLELLKLQLENSLQRSVEKPTVMLLFHHAREVLNNEENNFFIKSKIVPSYAVAYTLNKAAAQLLLASQFPIKSVADWPLCTHRVDYWLSRGFALAHGSETSKVSSYFEELTRSPSSFGRKWRWILGIDLIRHKRFSFQDLHKHYCFVLRPRLLRHWL
jgi:GR25 family glycosyltransferase involved in LPS biosynthesis